jgi:hypothetical protein
MEASHRPRRAAQGLGDLRQAPVMVLLQDERLALALGQLAQRLRQLRAALGRVGAVFGPGRVAGQPRANRGSEDGPRPLYRPPLPAWLTNVHRS